MEPVSEGAERFAAYDPAPERSGPVEIEVRQAEQGDIEACVALAVERDGGPAERWRSRFLTCLSGADRALFVARVDGDFAGYGRLEWLAPDDGGAPPGWYLVGVIVRTPWRRRGVATALTQARLDWAWQRTHEVWYFVNAGNRASLDLHDRFGFVEVTRDFSIPGVSFDDGRGSGILLRCERPDDPDRP
jgi:ribosomal protein S18 acetylase RimI-like enzyme